jgi:hypothetical protein
VRGKMSEIYIEKIKEYFPQLSEVKDKTLVDATCKIWVEALICDQSTKRWID